MSNYDQCSISKQEYNIYDNELSSWISDCFIQKFDIEKILYRLDNDRNIKQKLKYMTPTHQQFDYYYYLIQSISDCINTNENSKKYLEYIVKSQNFQNQISERCHLLITQANSIDNLEQQIEQIFQIFFLLKDIDMNVLQQSNISQIFTLQKIIEINYPECNFNALFSKFDDFLCLIQESAQKLIYKNIPADPQPLEFIQFGRENKQIFGQFKKFDTYVASIDKSLDYLFNKERENYIYDYRYEINYLSEKGFYKPINRRYINNIKLYQDIKLISFDVNNFDILWEISLNQFSLDGGQIKIIDQNYSHIFMPGSLICITNVECHPLLFGIITNRNTNINNDNMLDIQSINIKFRLLGSRSNIMEFLNLLSQQTIVMECIKGTQVESEIQFLESIKKIKSLPQDNLIPTIINQVCQPQYLQKYFLENSLPVMPSTLDESQLKAMMLILSQEVVSIQGLPGTGKTYCGTLAVKILNEILQPKDKPILIVCQNNHTLDYFLERLLQYIPINQMTRLEKTSKSVIIEKCMFASRNNIEFDQNKFQELKKQLNIIFNRLIQYDYTINAQDITRFWPELSNKLINDFLDDKDLNNLQFEDLAKNQILNSWINVKCLNVSLIQYESELFGVHERFQKEQIIEQVKINNILGTKKTDQSNDQQYQDHIDLNCSSQNNQSSSLIEQFNNQNCNQFNLHYNFKGIEKIQQFLQDKTFNSWELNYIDFCEIIKYFKYLKYQEDCLLFEKTYKKFKTASKIIQNCNNDEQIDELNNYQIIGVTISDAVHYINKLKQLNSKVLIMEEAEQVLGSDIATILTNNIQHLILIGDQIDLKDSLTRYELEDQTNISLLERLYLNQIPSVVLSTQRRMKTKLADFVRVIYNQHNLDHLDIQQKINNEEIKGLNSDFHIINHQQHEINEYSKENAEEAEMIFQMVQYLIQVGYKESQISVLSFYKQQVSILKKKFMNQNQQKVKVERVHEYLGQENDIVIISLVLNDNRKLFYKEKYENRIKIAFSRARIGLYVFGNFDFRYRFICRDSLLVQIISLAKEKNYFTDSITLKCQTHGTLRNVQESSDWFKFKAGCCDQVCNIRFDECHHTCQKICHLGNHLQNNCEEQCQRILRCRHQCKQQCQSQCICTQMISVTLSACNHKTLILCGTDPEDVICQQDQEIYFFKCKHTISYRCYQRDNFLQKCQNVCEKVLQCGHNCNKKCWEICQPCEQNCIKSRVCGHKDKCQNLCYELCSPCTQKISVKLDCGKHCIQKECFEIQNLLIKYLKVTPYFFKSKMGSANVSFIIEKLSNGSKEVLQIFYQMPDFICKDTCSKTRNCDYIDECKNQGNQEHKKMTTIFLECGHEYELLFKDQQNFVQNLIKCQKKCIRIRQCGHKDPCLNMCGYECSPCQQIITKTFDCGHQIFVDCSSEIIQCNQPCAKIRACQHYYPCSNYCSQPCSPCLVEILINLPCSHQKLVKCYTVESTGQKQLDYDQNCEFCQTDF